ncbi:hypothetical protein [Haloprofundus salilacus]|uniref:hypothetical protein n=1 Tax=Haloprofundus salilacus TaxID=2876190 RepID=UPI001CD00EA9|nr:hypothetical protein [Haloprofundus salilacus]
MKSVVVNLSFDETLDALAHVQRRKLLVGLLDHNPQNDTPVVIADSADEATSLERLVKMHHVHLPKLEEYGLIVWNEDKHEVSKGKNFDEIKPLLELLATHEDELPPDWL